MVVNVLKSCLSANPYDRKILSRAKHIYSKTSDPNLTSCLVPHLKKLPESYISLPFINILANIKLRGVRFCWACRV